MAETANVTAKSSRDMLSAGEISAFCTQISMILKSGIPVSEGIGIMCADMKNNQGKEILEEIHLQVESGSPLFMALASTGRFPKYVVDMMEIGETTGKLDNVMDSLCDYYEREETLSKNIKNAITYPLVMIGMMVLVIAVLVIKVMPIFEEVFASLGSEMSGFSQSVLRMGQAIGNYSVIIVCVLAALIVLFLIFRRTKGGRASLEKFKASFFVTRKLYDSIASGRFASAMALMLASGLDTDKSLEMVHRLVDHPIVQKKIEDCQKLLAEGVTFSDAIVKASIFTGVYARMISVGFKTGSLDTIMQKLATRYQEEIDSRVGGIISVLEPTLVAILSIIVGMILLSVMLPLMGIMASIG